MSRSRVNGRRPRPVRWIVRLLLVVAAAAALVAAGVLVLVRLLLEGSAPARVLETVLSAATGARATVGSLKIDLVGGRATARDIAIGGFFSAREARAEFDPRSLAEGAPRVVSVVVDGAVIRLGESTLPEIARAVRRAGEGAGGKGGAGSAPLVRIASGVVRIDAPNGAVEELRDLSATIEPSGAARFGARSDSISLAASREGADSPVRGHADFAPGADRGAFEGLFPVLPESLSVEWTIETGEELAVEATLRARIPRGPVGSGPRDVAAALFARSRPDGAGKIDRVEIDGLLDARVAAEGSFDASAGSLEVRGVEPLRVALEGGATLVADAWSLAAGRGGALRVEASLRSEGAGEIADGARLRAVAARSSSERAYSVEFDAEARLESIGGEGTARMSGRGRIETSPLLVRVDSARLEWPGIGSAAVDGEVAIDARRIERLRVDVAREVEIADVARAAERATGRKLGAARLRGSARGVCEVGGLALDGGGPETMSGLVLARDVGFVKVSSSGAPIEAEGLRFAAAVAAERDSESGAFRGRLSGDAGNLVVLWGEDLVDLSGRVFTFEAPFERDPESGVVRLEDATLRGGDFGTITATGIFGGARTDVDVALADVSLRSVYTRVVLPNESVARPGLGRLAVTGRLDARLRFEEEEKEGVPLRATGEASVSDAALTGDGFAATGVSFLAPVALGAAARDTRDGFLRVGEVDVGGVTTGAFELPLEFSPGGVRLKEPSRIYVLGGEIEIESFHAASFDDAEAVVHVREIDAARIGRAAGLPIALAGVVESDGPLSFTARPGEIDGRGAIVARVLGGDVRAGAFRVETPFSSVPRLGFDATLSHLDLEKVTAALAYGEISGDLSGEVRGVVVSRFGPERFALRFEGRGTDERPARASVKAIRELPFLSSSGRLTLQGFLFNAINAFGYSRFGAVAVLDDERFVVRGRYDADGLDLYGAPGALAFPFNPPGRREEYVFLGRGLVPRLDIIVEPPEGPLSFPAFVRQIKRAREARLE